MRFWFTVIRQVGRNLKQTWGSQLMTLLTVTLSVLIFAFFYLIYSNMLHLGAKLGNDLTLTVYLDEDPGPELKQHLENKIRKFDDVESITFISSHEAYTKFADRLGDDKSVLDDVPTDFLPSSIEIVPLKSLRSLNKVKLFSDYLSKLPGTIKVQYGQDWVERFFYFTKLLSFIVLLSGALLILTTIFMVAYTIRLTLLGRQDELELLKLVGATNNYIRTPFLLEGVLQGVFGSTLGIISLYMLFQWMRDNFSGPGFLNMFEFSFFSPGVSMVIIGVSILLCSLGSYSTMHKFLRV